MAVNLNIISVAAVVHQWNHNAHHFALHRVHRHLFVATPVHHQNLVVVHLCRLPVCRVPHSRHCYLAPHVLSFVRHAQVILVLLVHLYPSQCQLLLNADLSIEHLLLLVDYSMLEQSGVILVYHTVAESFVCFISQHPVYNYLINKIFTIKLH